jgi:Uma2 family endonuclease
LGVSTLSSTTPARRKTSRQVSALIDPSEKLYRLTVVEYERIGELLNDPKVELIDGLMVAKMVKNPPHAVACGLARAAIDGVVTTGWHTRAAEPISIPRYNEPEPDVVLARGEMRDYSAGHPRPKDVALVVEVADTTLAKDRRRARVYGGRRGIPVFWIVNLIDRHVEVYTRPCASGYTSRAIYLPGSHVPVVVDGTTVGQIAVLDLLP